MNLSKTLLLLEAGVGNRTARYGQRTVRAPKVAVSKPNRSRSHGRVATPHSANRKPNPSMPKMRHGMGQNHRSPNPSMRFDKDGEPMVGNMSRNQTNEQEVWFDPKYRRGNKPTKAISSAKKKKLQGMGELDVPTFTTGNMDVRLKFHPPSLRNPQRVPSDQPGETDDRFLDVTKRKQARKDQLKRLKRSAPGGAPAMVPVRTTGVEPHSAVYQFGMFAGQRRPIVIPAKPIGGKVTRVLLKSGKRTLA